MSLIYCNTGHKDISDGCMVVFSPSIMALESHILISHVVYSCLKYLQSRGADLGIRMRKQLNGCVRCIAVDECFIISIVSECQCRQGTSHIGM